VLSRIVDTAGEDWLGQPLPDIPFTPRAERNSLIASRVVTVAT
jgi:hypothetical protein